MIQMYVTACVKIATAGFTTRGQPRAVQRLPVKSSAAEKRSRRPVLLQNFFILSIREQLVN